MRGNRTENDMSLKKEVLRTTALCGLVGIIAIGGTAAYLTDYDSTVNEFTVGKVDIELLEPNWHPEEHTDMEPTEVLSKDPQIKNIGVNDAFVYLEVSVPMADIITADLSGNRMDSKVTELFSFTKKSDWTQLEAKISGDTKIYTYAYNKILEPQETSTALFDSVTFANIIEGQLDAAQLEIPVRAYAIQTVNTGDDSGTIAQQARSAYEKYVNQNMNQSGAVTK